MELQTEEMILTENLSPDFYVSEIPHAVFFFIMIFKLHKEPKLKVQY